MRPVPSFSQEPQASHRLALMDDLYRRYAGGPLGGRSVMQRLRFWRKKSVWIRVVGGVVTLKRAIDFVVAATLFVGLAPLFTIVAVLIKLTNQGPVLFWQTRVGRWGREFPFPKFRSMVVDAERMKDALLDQSDHQGGVTFKMKQDPRVTWIGRIIRPSSLDELPLLWCVPQGDMSLTDPRPPVPREVSHYPLADRRRLDVIPGLTCIWQVSGRGDIPFLQQIAFDVQYIQSRNIWVDIKLLVQTIPAVLLEKGAY